MAERFNYLLIAVKALTFVPLAAVIYYTEYTRWVSYFFTTHSVGFIIASVALFALGVILKRRIVGTYLQTSKNNMILGSLALSAAAGLYILGTLYSPSSPVLAYESLIVFAVSYVFLRSDPRLVRLLWPLFAILGVAPLAPVLSGAMGNLSGLIIVIVMFGLYDDAYLVRSTDDTKENIRLLALPAFIVVLGLAYWFFVPGAKFLIALIPISLVILVAPKISAKLQISRLGLPESCPGHRETDDSGFCVICGQKFTSMKNLTTSGLAGLVIAVIVLGILLTTQVPILTVNGPGPSTSVYSYTGVASHPILSTPAGWLVNSSVVLTEPNDSYAVKQVYVPIYHPEVKNYTLYFELAFTNPNLWSTAWGALPGFNRSSVDLTLDGFGGRLINYSSPQTFMMVFTEKSTFTFANGSNFYYLDEAVTYVRNFTGISSTAAKSEVVADLNSTFVPILANQRTPHAWTNSFSAASQTLNALSGLFLTSLTSAGIVVAAFLVKQSDYKIDAFETRGSDLDENEWELLSSILKFRDPRTTLEISSDNMPGQDKSQDFWGRFEDALENLETKRVIRRTWFERKSEILFGWQAEI